MAPAIVVQDLRKRYGDVEAVRGVSFEVDEGRVFAFLGPNGAGKTTTVEICEGFRPRDGGLVTVLGHDPARGERELKRRIGIVLQSTGVDLFLTVAETVEFYRRAYPDPRPLDEVIDVVGLVEKRDTRVGKLSGGQQRRLDVAVALAGDPELLFLDEPTAGLDPDRSESFVKLIQGLHRELNLTVVMITHDLDTVVSLSDRVAVLADQKLVAVGTIEEVAATDHPFVRNFFQGDRGRRAIEVWKERKRSMQTAAVTPPPAEYVET